MRAEKDFCSNLSPARLHFYMIEQSTSQSKIRMMFPNQFTISVSKFVQIAPVPELDLMKQDRSELPPIQKREIAISGKLRLAFQQHPPIQKLSAFYTVPVEVQLELWLL